MKSEPLWSEATVRRIVLEFIVWAAFLDFLFHWLPFIAVAGYEKYLYTRKALTQAHAHAYPEAVHGDPSKLVTSAADDSKPKVLMSPPSAYPAGPYVIVILSRNAMPVPGLVVPAEVTDENKKRAQMRAVKQLNTSKAKIKRPGHGNGRSSYLAKSSTPAKRMGRDSAPTQ